MKNGRPMRNMVRMTTLAGAALATGLTLIAPGLPAVARDTAARPAASGGPYATAITVNGLGISNYEIEQRMAFMQALRQAGDLRKQAEDALIDDRLRAWQATRDGITVSEDDITKGMTEFAGRANLSLDQFTAELAKSGVGTATFHDFVRSGLMWREVIRARFAPRVKISDADINRALLVESRRGQNARVLLSEIIIPAPPEHLDEARALAKQVAAVRGEAAFSSAAQQVSASQSRDNGGKIDWLPLGNLPPVLRDAVLAMKPGQVSAPIDLNGAIGVFLLRDFDAGTVSKEAQSLGYATLALGPAGSEETQKLEAQIASDAHSCDDLYTIAKDRPGALSRVAPTPQGQIPPVIAVELARLDIGETGVLDLGAGRTLVMLCSRTAAVGDATPDGGQTPDLAPAPSAPKGPGIESTKAEDAVHASESLPGGAQRDQIRQQLMNVRLSAYSENFLAELRSDAVVVRK